MASEGDPTLCATCDLLSLINNRLMIYWRFFLVIRVTSSASASPQQLNNEEERESMGGGDDDDAVNANTGGERMDVRGNDCSASHSLSLFLSPVVLVVAASVRQTEWAARLSDQTLRRRRVWESA